MTISKKDEERLAAQAEYIESDAPLPATDPARIRRGAASAAFGHQLLLEALGSEEAIEQEVRRGRPPVGSAASTGKSSPVIRARIDEERLARLDAITADTHKERSVLVREAIDLLLASYEDGHRSDAAVVRPVDIRDLLKVQVSLRDAAEMISAMSQKVAGPMFDSRV